MFVSKESGFGCIIHFMGSEYPDITEKRAGNHISFFLTQEISAQIYQVIRKINQDIRWG